MKKTRCLAAWCRDDEQHDRNSTGICHSASEVLGQLTRPSAMRWSKAPTSSTLPWWVAARTPFQQWHERRIYDKATLSRAVGAVRLPVQAVHHLRPARAHYCPDADAALLMLHRMSRYIPHFIALSASSPYVQGRTRRLTRPGSTRCSRSPVGPRPDGADLGRLHHLLQQDDPHRRGQSMKDFYWDIRPKPEFGTIEIRVFDTPLTIGVLRPRRATCSRWARGSWPTSPSCPKRTTTS